MQDFKRIGGEILSSPLNENFRRLRNDISIANTNLVFSDQYGIMATTADMYALINDTTVSLTEGQVCYVVSSGELYRYSNLDNDWHRIADFGQTFRQAFLNSGVVLMEEPIKLLSDGYTLKMPRMLVYFKNKPGEDPYLKGMYLLGNDESKRYITLNLADLDNDKAYSIMVNYLQEYTVIPGIPSTDDPNNVFIGSFIVPDTGLQQEFIYSIPDIAYTADRGGFLLNGGECSGCDLYATNAGVGRKSGYYYDEGANYPGQTYYTYTFPSLAADTYYFNIDDVGYFFTVGPDESIDATGTLYFYSNNTTKIYVKQLDVVTKIYTVIVDESSHTASFVLEKQNSIDNYPKSLDDTSNYNILQLPEKALVNDAYYTNTYTPIASLQNILDITEGGQPVYTKGIIYDKYNNGSEHTVTPGEFTIQRHLVTPSGQNIIVLGVQEYIDKADAQSHLNDDVPINGDFLYAEVTRIIVQNPEAGVTFNPTTHCEFYTLNRLSLAGQISPIFDDEEFKIYDGSEYTPWFLQFKLDNLAQELSASTYNLLPMKYSDNPDPWFGITTQYVADVVSGDGETPTKDRSADYNRVYTNDIEGTSLKGYTIPSDVNIKSLRKRVAAIEAEIWNIQKESGTKRYNESVRYRLYKLENDIYNNYGDDGTGRTENIVNRLKTAEDDIDKAELLKANKSTLINGHQLGDPSDTYPQIPYVITLITNDIDEPANAGVNDHRWFDEQLVRDTDWVADAHAHVGHQGTGTESNANPHAMSTDDITLLQNSDNRFVTRDEKGKLANVPNNTIQEITTLQNTKIESIPVYVINDATQVETKETDMKTLKIHSYGAHVTHVGDTAILECVGQIDENAVLMRRDYTSIADSTAGKDGYVDKALVADYAESINTTGVTASQYYGTDADYESTDPEVEPTVVGWHDLPVYVSTENAQGAANIDSILLRPEEKSVALKHLATSRVVYTAADEEAEIGDNVYNLVKNHYHKVYNSGSQGPYIEDPNNPGSYIQDISSIIYTYKVPYGGLAEHTYYLEYNNNNYSFNTTNLGTIPVDTILTYIPSSGNIEITISGTTSTLTTNQVQPSVVDEQYYLEFVAQTDWSKINQWNFGNNLTVTVSDGIATINAFNASGDTPVHAFVNLDDVDFIYNNVQPGQMLVINADGDGIDVSNAPSLSSYMLISDYVNSSQPTKVNAAVAADTAASAALASSAALLQGTYSVNDNNTDTSSLWTANKISTFVSARIAAEGVRTDYGTTVPASHTFAFTPKRGDLYILTES